MKKFILIVSALAMAAAVSACGAGNINQSGQAVTSSASESAVSSPSSQTTSSKAANVTYEKNLSGLAQSMKDKGYITGEPSAMKASIIGAKDGSKYEAVLDKTKFSIELYEYDTASLNDAAKKVIDEVKTSGQFTIMAHATPAILSNNGKYLMVYTDTSETEANAAHRTEVQNVLKAFQ